MARLAAQLVLIGLVLSSAASAQVVVESVEPRTAGARAGFRTGDALVSWERLDAGRVIASGDFTTPFDVRQFQIEQLPRGATRVVIRRGGERRLVMLAGGFLGVETGLELNGSNAVRYGQGLDAALRNDIVKAVRTWRSLASSLEPTQPVAAIWLYCRLGSTIVAPISTGFWPEEALIPKGVEVPDADRSFAAAATLARRLGDRRMEAMVHEAAGAAWKVDVLVPLRASLGRVRKSFAEAFRIRQAVDSDSLSVAASLQSLAGAWAWNDDRREPPDVRLARRLYERALRLQIALAPSSFDEALSRLKLALLLHRHFPAERGRAQALSREAVATLSLLAPGTQTLRVARVLGSLLAGDAGDYAAAARLARESLNTGTHTTADSELSTKVRFGYSASDDDLFGYIGRTHLAGGQLLQAAASLRMRARLTGLEPPVFMKRRSDWLTTPEADPYLMLDFGDYAFELSNDRSAAAFYRHALTLARGTGDEPSNRMRDLLCLASGRLVALGEATSKEHQELDSSCSASRSPDARVRDPYGEHLLLLARANLATRRPAAALALSREAVRIRRKGGSPLWLARALHVFGEAQCSTSAFPSGALSLSEANRLYASSAAATRHRIAALTTLGRCARDGGRVAEATRVLRQAVRLAESASAEELQGHVSRALETAVLADAHHELTAVLVERGRFSHAFAVAEAGRARSLRRLLSERRLPEESRPAWMEAELKLQLGKRAVLWTRYAAAQRELANLSPSSAPGEYLLRVARLHGLGLALDAAESRLRSAFTLSTNRRQAVRLGSESAAVPAVARALAPGGLLLEYSVSRKAAFLFVIDPQSKHVRKVVTIPRGYTEIDALVRQFRSAVESMSTGNPNELIARGRALYDLLLRPVESLLGAADRLVIVPDGPLVALPFAALVREARGTEGTPFLIKWKPIHVAPSAATYVLLQQQPRAPEPRTLVAVADPVTAPPARQNGAQSGGTRGDTGPADSAPPSGVAERESLARGVNRRPLPGSRREAEGIARIMERNASVLMGRDATEARIRSVGPTAGILHFATHAVVNNAFLMDSGLVLSEGHQNETGADDGWLQAWEIVDQLRLQADLVTLSACESATGRALPGEGAMSLARAFHAAGARSVVSALWSIDDTATAALMTAFYSALRAGSPKDEALRRAQLTLIEGAGTKDKWRAPAYWAAFQLSGDWR